MSAWKDQRRAEHLAAIATFGSTVTFNNLTADCLSDSKEIVSINQRTSQMPQRPAKFSLLREEFDRIGLKTTVGQPRQVVQAQGFNFEIYAVIDDDADATIDMRATLKL